MKIAVLCLALICLVPMCWAQSNDSEFSAPVNSASVNSLLDSLRRSEVNIAEIRKDQAETKAQIPKIINSEVQKILIVLVLFFISFYSFSKLLGRVYDVLNKRRWRSKNERDQEKILSSQAEIIRRLSVLSLEVNTLENMIGSIKGDAAQVLKDKAPSVPWYRPLMFWRRG